MKTINQFPPIALMHAKSVDDYFRNNLHRKPEKLQACMLIVDNNRIKHYTCDSVMKSTTPEEYRIMECYVSQLHTFPDQIENLGKPIKSTTVAIRSAQYARERFGLAYNEWSEKAKKLQRAFIERYNRLYHTA